MGGIGGAELDDLPPDRLVMGGGGGAGEATNAEAGSGAAGGGVIFIRALSMSGTGTIRANGSNGGGSSGGHNAGAGGGGAGGTVVLRTQATCAVTVQATGGNGGATGSGYGCGGGGSGGRIYVQATGGSRTVTLTQGAPGATTWSCVPAASAAEPGVSTVETSPFCSTNATCAPLTATPACLVSAGKCVECTSNTDCTDPSQPTCASGTCVACQVDGDCTVTPKLVCQTAGALDDQCTECKTGDVTHCDPATAPACSATTGNCTTCTGSAGSGGDAPCPDAAKPACSGGLCYQCSTTNPTAWCTNAAAPACRTTDKTCVACNGDNGGSGNAPCPTTTAPACTSGRCYPCSPGNTSQCTTTAAPACRTTDWTCAACNGDNGSGATAPCPTTARAWCVAPACQECTPTHLDSCTSAEPACDTSGSCAQCDSHFGASTGNAHCPDSTLPACELVSGTCLQCTTTHLSACTSDKPACMSDHTCGCTTDAECRAGGNNLRLCNTTNRSCFDGCRGNETLCPSGFHCSSIDSTPGTCVANPGVDAGQPDVGQPDVGQPDVGQPDVGTSDTGTIPPDAATALDAGPGVDVGVADTGIVEPPDAEIAYDAELPSDAELPTDATVLSDAAAPFDGAVPADTGAVVLPDATVAPVDGSVVVKPDASGLSPTYDLGGCGCGSAAGASLAPWGLLGLALFAGGLRRRSYR